MGALRFFLKIKLGSWKIWLKVIITGELVTYRIKVLDDLEFIKRVYLHEVQNEREFL